MQEGFAPGPRECATTAAVGEGYPVARSFRKRFRRGFALEGPNAPRRQGRLARATIGTRRTGQTTDSHRA